MIDKKNITEENIKQIALELGCEPEVIKAVAQVESAGEAFDEEGKPVILFEAHLFSKLTKGKYDLSHPKLSSPSWNKSLYTKDEYTRLNQAMVLDDNAALKSCSWGKFQILGLNHAVCGFKTVKQFVQAMNKSELEHLKAFASFIKGNNLAKYLMMKDFANFASRYNGPGYRANKYDIKMRSAYNKLKGL